MRSKTSKRILENTNEKTKKKVSEYSDKKLMDIKKWNRKNLALRIFTFPLKLVFQLTWGVLSSIVYSFKWLKNGSQEVVYGDDFSSSIVRLIDQNQEMIDKMNKKRR